MAANPAPPIKTCVLGVGLSGLTFHIPFVLALPALYTLHAVMERNPKTEGGKVKDRFGVSVTIYRTLEEVLGDPEIELIIVGTPTHTHYSITKAALQAGKHVMVDKPVTCTAAEAQELGALAESKNLVLYAYQNRRWDSDFLALKRLLSEPSSSRQSLGTVTEFESHYDRYRNDLKGSWKDLSLPGNGIVYDLGSHLIDQTLQLFGRPSRITGFAENMRRIGSPNIDDSFTILLYYPPTSQRPLPLTAILRAHILSVRSPQLRFVVRGSQGSFVKYGLDVQEDQLKEMPSPVGILQDPEFGQEPASICGIVENLEPSGEVTQSVWPSTDRGCYIELFRNLAGAIRHGEEMEVKWAEATAVIELIEMAHRSSTERRTLDVPWAAVPR